ncbi:FAD-dependent monooxygenase [Pseudomonas soli]|jgi:2-polyprenyl-6-methoxyphenol hydroxylase-like FAD-dependent oxidoreductase|uniref:2-polyprenyl-6-methoxyphenol hydroxylase n=1 Tax=Pseudomonas soli TaxID=1306993 RepID=A0A1H9F9J2_9PSED|nr:MULTISPECIES: NAD(P)/FAD-dependent oxidoreductase [Pseudomonas]AIN57482.1 monooxygenase [Pseudomonas soli]AUY33029.1 FAD-dependent monooxygenase [Pseudomonas sp. PONIH3]MCX5509387.1 FAD-dependent monooxygenase [Pseudomonas sp. BJa3]MDF9755875.1 2-polyprenyl-6-methoxyphenol hydroxylase-like FAD-dependent oxidoreductase [Pseudomonas hunanensis]MDT3713154.1 NAD(P)/FAD-dependent oxidoreductase [Pseudomonas soli]
MKIAIIGAGLNGLACALILKRFGLEATVYERAHGPRDSGTGIYVWPQGVQVLRFLFNDTGFIGRGKAIEFLDTHGRDGRLIHSQPVRPDGLGIPAPAVMFPRPELFGLLRERLAPGQIRYQMGCEKVEKVGEQARVTFSNGEQEDFDLVIGSDGVGSTVRQCLEPGLTPYDTGLVASRGMVEFDSPLLLPDRCQIFASEFSRVVTYPLAADRPYRYWFAAYQHRNQPLLDRDGLVRLFADLPPDVVRMMEATEHEQILTHKMMALTGAGCWQNGRVVMLGDSIHAMLPTLGYGLTLGLENAFMLAQALVGCCDERLDSALQRYEIRAAERSRVMLEVMRDMTDLYYFEEDSAMTSSRIRPIVERFHDLALTTVF